MSTSRASVRLYVLLARKSPLAVVFRRGPSKQVLALVWDTSNDVIRSGQWFKGRIYERRCDLSPSGEKLLYFAAKYGSPLDTWTAISRPPYLTALALWAKGDAWGGGGLFRDEQTVELNHRQGETTLAPNFQLPKGFTVDPFGEHPGRGEDGPILAARMIRDGWVLREPGNVTEHSWRADIAWTFAKHQVWTKTRGSWTIELRLLGISERDGPWYVIEHRLLNESGQETLRFGRSDWADWSRGGDLLLARAGRLFRVPVRRKHLGTLKEIADLRTLRFSNVAAPKKATEWSGMVAATGGERLV